MKKILLLIFAISSLIACDNKTADQAILLEKETTKIHDEVMPITFKIRDLRDSVMKAVAKSQDSTLKNEGQSIANEIQKADSSMDEFMNKLGDALNNESDAATKVKLYGTLKIEGESVKKQTLAAKIKAEAYLKK